MGFVRATCQAAAVEASLYEAAANHGKLGSAVEKFPVLWVLVKVSCKKKQVNKLTNKDDYSY